MLMSLPERVVVSAATLISVKCVIEPFSEIPCCQGIVPNEYRRPLHILLDDSRLDAPALGQQPHSAAVARDERTFRGRKRDVEAANCMFADDEQGPSKSHRDLSNSEEIFNVAGKDGWVNRIFGDMIKLSAGSLGHETAPRVGDALAIVVIFVARDLEGRLG